MTEKIKPRLKCSFGMNISGCVIDSPVLWNESAQTINTYNGEIQTIAQRRSINARWFRLMVENVGVDCISNCAARLRSLVMEGGIGSLTHNERVDLPFIPAGAIDSLSREIRSGQEEHLDFLYITADNVPKIRTLTPSPAYDWDHMFRLPRDYTFDILISSSNAASINATVVFSWTGDWQTATVRLVS